MIRSVFFIFGIGFGFVLIMAGVSNYNVIQEMFLFESFHLYGVLMVAVGITFVSFYILRKLKVKALLTQDEIVWKREKIERKHIIGGLMAGGGWALTGACPGPALALIGFGTISAIFIATGIFVGVYFYGSSQS